MRIKIYLAGRITGNPNYKIEFGEAARFYEERGFIVLNPALLPAGMEYADYARICAAMIDSADAVVLLPDWEMSQGAQIEKAYAEYIGRDVALYDDNDRMTELLKDGEKTLNEVRIANGLQPLREEAAPLRIKHRRSVEDEILDRFMSEEF